MADAASPGDAVHADGTGGVAGGDAAMIAADVFYVICTRVCVCVCVCVCVHSCVCVHFIYHLPIPYSAFERKCDWYFYGGVRVCMCLVSYRTSRYFTR